MSELIEVKKNEDIEEGAWTELDMSDICSMFGDFIIYSDEVYGQNFDKDNFDFEIFNEDYYKEKFPGFSNEIYEILARVSKQKIIDLRKTKETINIKKGNFKLHFDEDSKEE